MSALPRRDYITLEEYYGLDGASDRRWEYWDGEIYCMSGSSDPNHGKLASRVHWLLFSLFEAKGCEAFTEGQAVKCEITDSLYVYPDVSAACKPRYEKYKERGIVLLANPCIIVEVLSPESVLRDNNLKKDGYQAIPSLRDYLIVDPKKVCIHHWRMIGGKWKKRTYEKLGDVIELTCADAALPLKDIYKGWKPYKS